MSLEIRDAVPDDAEAICRLYNPHVRGTIVTFEEIDVTVAEMQTRIAQVSSVFPWLVGERSGNVVAYAYASKFQERTAYRYSVFSTIYVDEDVRRQGIGTSLYRALLERLRASPIRTALGGIALPNPASIALHEKCGYAKVAHLERVGFKFGHWIDVGYWQIAW